MRLLFARLDKFFPKSLVSDFCTLFGEKMTEKLLMVFGGMTLKIPSHQDVQDTERDIVIYESLIRCRTPEEARRVRRVLSLKHHVSKRKIRGIFGRMQRLHRQAAQIRDADQAVGRSQVKKLHIRRLKRQRRL